MPEMLTDLWPEFETENIVTPLAILRFQAGQLRVKTKALFEAEVRTTQFDNGRVSHEFVVIAPALDRYEYVVATFSHDVTLVYPVDVIGSELSDEPIYCSGQDELLGTVSEILRSAKVRSVISSLIAQSRDLSSLSTSSGVM